MESLLQIPHSHPPFFHLSLNHRRSSLSSSISFRPLQFPSFSSPTPFHLSPIRASSSPKNPNSGNPKNTLTHILQTLFPIFSFLIEPVCVATVAASLFFLRRHYKQIVAVTPAAPPPETTTELLYDEENDTDERLKDDAEALKTLVQDNISEGKIDEAIRAIDGLIELEPDELEWPIMKTQIYVYKEEHELAFNGFEDVLKKDRFRVDALHGLMLVTFKLNKPIDDLLSRIDEAVKFYEIEKRDSEIRDLKLLMAQVKVIEEDFDGAVRVYEEIEKEEPEDFRPYLCRGIVYTMLRRKDEADEQFEKFRKRVPDDHPYKEYFEDNATEFSLQLAREGMATKR
ncbi:unnamed protein product [Lupinus luteus]|uniref:Chloroplast lumen common family protein n=1 Tax=Lupinus luteus TaxID=3873 RepID=A0AAV1VRJ2_LUPLU